MKRQKNLAFSLIELLITIALIGICASIALPTFASLKQKSQYEILRNALHSSLQNARTQAILYRRSVEVCGAGNEGTCTNKWQNGWKSHFVDSPQSPFEMHQHHQTNPLYWAGFSKTIRFHANGTSPISNGRFFQCKDGLIIWQLVINRQGRVRTSTAVENREQSYRCPG